MGLTTTPHPGSKGLWMKLRDPQLLADYMAVLDFTQSRLARRAGCSRQFVWQLLNDPAKRTCSGDVAARIEEALSVRPGTIFRHSGRAEEAGSGDRSLPVQARG